MGLRKLVICIRVQWYNSLIMADNENTQAAAAAEETTQETTVETTEAKADDAEAKAE